MKTFKGKQIFNQPAPTPKLKQIWKKVNTDELVEVVKLVRVKKELLQCWVETESGSQRLVGLAWFDNKDYVFIGTIN